MSAKDNVSQCKFSQWCRDMWARGICHTATSSGSEPHPAREHARRAWHARRQRSGHASDGANRGGPETESATTVEHGVMPTVVQESLFFAPRHPDTAFATNRLARSSPSPIEADLVASGRSLKTARTHTTWILFAKEFAGHCEKLRTVRGRTFPKQCASGLSLSHLGAYLEVCQGSSEGTNLLVEPSERHGVDRVFSRGILEIGFILPDPFQKNGVTRFRRPSSGRL